MKKLFPSIMKPKGGTKVISTGESSPSKKNNIAPPPQEQTTEPSEILTTDGASEVDDMTRNLIASTMAAFRRNG